MRVGYTRERIALDAVEDPIVRDGIAYWRSLCRGRAFPARADVTPHAMKKLLSHTIITRVVDGGADYEYRIVGQVHVDIHPVALHGGRLMKLEGLDQPYRALLKSLYDEVVLTRAPTGNRASMKAANGGPAGLRSVSAFLPLGDSDDAVDHVLVFATYTPPA